jgi:hypothetical protein
MHDGIETELFAPTLYANSELFPGNGLPQIAVVDNVQV